MSDHQFAEVTILVDDDAVIGGSLLCNAQIVGALHELLYVGQVMAGLSKRDGDPGRATLIRQEPHLFCRDEAFEGQLIGGISLCGLNIGLGDIRIVAPDILKRSAAGTAAPP